MTKSELVERLVEANGALSRKESEVVVNLIFDSMCDALQSGEKVEIRGFGSFTIREREAARSQKPQERRCGQNTGQENPFLQNRQGTSREGQQPVIR